jgi:hypothetical protein
MNQMECNQPPGITMLAIKLPNLTGHRADNARFRLIPTPHVCCPLLPLWNPDRTGVSELRSHAHTNSLLAGHRDHSLLHLNPVRIRPKIETHTRNLSCVEALKNYPRLAHGQEGSMTA